jgi:hypothetical protein
MKNINKRRERKETKIKKEKEETCASAQGREIVATTANLSSLPPQQLHRESPLTKASPLPSALLFLPLTLHLKDISMSSSGFTL